MRIAVDTPLAVFEFQAATKAAEKAGGLNHITRTFYFHLLHLLAAGAQPLFVFDGPNKPREKGSHHPSSLRPCNHVGGPMDLTSGDFYFRNNGIRAASDRTQQDMACERKLSHVIALCREVLGLLGIPHRDAPGEAEAECAALEREGIVDAVMTKDGDAFVFGSRHVLQKDKAENTVAMVRQYLMADLEAARPTLRSQDMFLLAIMSGGDYDDGIPGCGPKAAIEVARAGYSGRLKAAMTQQNLRALTNWRTDLVEELRDNPRGKLSTRYAAISRSIPAQFPDPRIANLYLTPAISHNLASLEVNWDQDVSVDPLLIWTKVYFDWQYAHMVGKFARTLVHPLLVKRLLLHISKRTDGSALIANITRSKGDEAIPSEQELRVGFRASQVVGIDVSQEKIDWARKAANLKDEVYDPDTVEKQWIPRWIIEHGAPTAYHQWLADLAKKKTPKGGKRKAASSPCSDQNSPLPKPSDENPVQKRPRGRPPKINPLAGETLPVTPSFHSTAPPNRPRGRSPKTPSSRRLAGSIQAPVDVDYLDDSDDFPDISDIIKASSVKVPADKTRAAHATAACATSFGGKAQASARSRSSDIIDLTSD